MGFLLKVMSAKLLLLALPDPGGGGGPVMSSVSGINGLSDGQRK